MEDPVIIFDKETDSISKMNDSAAAIFNEPSSKKEVGDVFSGIISVRMLTGKEVKTPIKTKNGEILSTVIASEEGENIKVKLPLDKNDWMEDMIETGGKVREVKSSNKALDQIKKAENRLKENTDFDSKEILLLKFDNIEEFNAFSLTVTDKSNVIIEKTTSMEDSIIARVEVRPPTRRVY